MAKTSAQISDKKSAAAVLIASSFNTNNLSDEDIHKVSERLFITDGSALIPKGNLNGVLKDVAAVKKLFDKQGIKTFHSFCSETRNPTKSEIIQVISSLFEKGEDYSIIYYSGHGETKTGNWVFERQTFGTRCVLDIVTYEEVKNLWRNRQNKKDEQHLLIIMDSCFSGQWTKEQYFISKDIIVQSSCFSDEQSYDTPNGGVFTQWWVQREHNEASKFAKYVYLSLSSIAYPIASFKFYQMTNKSKKCQMCPTNNMINVSLIPPYIKHLNLTLCFNWQLPAWELLNPFTWFIG